MQALSFFERPAREEGPDVTLREINVVSQEELPQSLRALAARVAPKERPTGRKESGRAPSPTPRKPSRTPSKGKESVCRRQHARPGRLPSAPTDACFGVSRGPCEGGAAGRRRLPDRTRAVGRWARAPGRTARVPRLSPAAPTGPAGPDEKVVRGVTPSRL